MKHLFIFLLLIPLFVFSQNKHTLSGYVKDGKSGESLMFGSISVKGQSITTLTNDYGFFSLTLPPGKYDIIVTYVGYTDQQISVDLVKDTRLNINMSPAIQTSDEVVIKLKKADENVKSSDMGRIDLPMEQLKTLPVLFGELDILKSIQLLPGVQAAGEGNTGFYVRGGGPDQNLILLDEAPVYNASHLFGFFSVFNSDAIKSTTLIKGGMPAEYGGRLSSVLDIGMKDGNNKTYHAEGGIGLISSRLTVEGPIQKEKSSFMLSGRRTYIDAVMSPFLKGGDYEGNRYFFYDFNAKMNYSFSDKNRLYLSGYYGKDVFEYKSPSGFFNIKIPWGNSTTTLRWNHLFSDKMFMNATLLYNDFKFETAVALDQWTVKFNSGIRDINMKVDFDYYASALHKIKFGGVYTYHTFTPSTASASSSDTLTLQTNLSKKYAHEAAAYIQDEFDINEKLKVNAGLRASLFQQIGPYTLNTFDEQDNPIDTTEYSVGEAVKTYSGIEPRISVRYLLSKTSSVKASFTKNNQYIHLVSNSASTLPTDIWVPSSVLVKPQIAYQYAIGFFKNFLENKYETSVEVYYKDMKNQIDFKEGYFQVLDKELERDFVFGKGWSYGVEFFLKKALGKFTGWMGYTHAYTMRKFEKLNEGNPFPAKFDRRNDMSLVMSYQLNKRWNFASTFVYATGNAFSVPSSRFIIGSNVYYDYEALNNYRMPAYHRWDLAATLYGKKHKKYSHYWVFAVYNAYNRKNPFFIYIERTGAAFKGDLKMQAKQVSLFPVLPSITWNFKF